MSVIEPAYAYRAVVRSIYDGDTLRADLDLGFGTWLHNQSLRLHGVDTAEIRGPERAHGLASRAWLEQRIPPGTSIIVQTFKDATGKYGRYLAMIWHEKINMNNELLARGLADPYPA